MMYEEMRLRPNGEIVRVYAIENEIATIFNPSQFMKSDQGWQRISVKKLVPVDYELHNAQTVSKTQKNKAKNRIKLIDAVWETSDGIKWEHKYLESAISHELVLMDADQEKKEMTE